MMKRYLVLMLGLLSSGTVQAEWHGFASVGAAWFSNDDADYVYNNLSSGAGHSHSVDWGLDSKLGLQWTASPMRSLRLNAQTVIARDAVNRFSPSLTLANLAYDVNERLSLTLGRTQNPNFLYSDHRHIAYALPWLRPPREVYGITSMFNYDGIQATIELDRQHDQRLKLVAGLAQAENSYSFDAGRHENQLDATGMVYASLSRQTPQWLFKFSMETGRLSTHNPMLTQALAVIGQTDVALAERMALAGKDYHLMALGIKYDVDDDLWLFELAHRHINAYFGARKGAYLTYGRRFAEWMPYITLARTQTELDKSQNPVAEQLFTSARDAVTTLTLGTSYELSSQLTLKAEAQWSRPDANSGWTYANYQPSYPLAKPTDDLLLSISMSTVF